MTYLKWVNRILSAVLAVCILASTPVTAGERDTQIKYIDCVEEISAEYNVCPELIESIIEAESNGDKAAKNGNCTGLMQVSSEWHKDRMKRLGVKDLKDPYSNILVGTDYLMELAGEYGDLYVVLATYHGEKNIDINNPSDYVIKIVNRSGELERIHGK